MSAILALFDKEQRRKRAIQRWEEERAERIEADVKIFMDEIRTTAGSNEPATFAWSYVVDHSEFTARVVAVVAANLHDECAIGHAVKMLVEHHLHDAAERKEDNRVIRIEDPDDE